VFARAARRLPGIRFESRSPALDEVLPRMDVAAFVGFASAGPVHVPVPLEDAATFADLFGADAPLAWDRERGEQVRANLGPAVRGFFRNGGLRCWVVRVAGDSAATAVFPVPGVLRSTPQGLRPLVVAARSPGSWSDGLQVGAALVASPAPVRAIGVDGGALTSLDLASPDTVAPGDVLRLRFADGRVVLVPVARVDAGHAELAPGRATWMRGAPAPGGGAWNAVWFPHHDTAPAPLPPVPGDPAWRSDSGTVTLALAGDVALASGTLLRLRQAGDEVWVTVTGCHAIATAGSPPVSATEVEGRWARPSGTPPGPLPLGGPLPTCERLRLELWIRDGGGHPRRLGDLGLAPGHPRYLGALPSDARMFDPEEDLLAEDERRLLAVVRGLAGDGATLRSYHADLWQAVSTPRFALAAQAGTEPFLPVGAPIVPDAYLGREATAAPAAARDGLASFSAGLFLDPDLADESVASLRTQADHLRWQARTPRRLKGLHALLNVDETTLVAVPDALHRGWAAERHDARPPLGTPILEARPQPNGGWRLTWTGVDPAATSVLEESATLDFGPAGEPFVHVVSPGAPAVFEVPPSPPAERWFRVRAALPRDTAPAGDPDPFLVIDDADRSSFWSDPVAAPTPAPQFVTCPTGALALPPLLALADGPDATGSYRLAWTAVPGALATTIEESEERDFEGAATVFSGPAHEVTIYGRGPGRRHYRARAIGDGGATGPWSPGLTVIVSSPPRQLLAPVAAFGAPARARLLDVQAALVRVAAARGDVLAVLGLPEHYRAGAAIGHVTELRARLDDELASSYAALYHPWVLVEGPDTGERAIRRASPEGVACGVMGARASARGAWIAPANEPFADVLGLTPPMEREQAQRLYEAQINLLRAEPHGFVTLAADTLAVDPALVPINVRRLLALLRRLALREGPTYVFEPHTPRFRRAVERHFEALLGGLFRDGAFAGATPGSSYQVAVDPDDQAGAQSELGRLVVDLKVAPSVPLSFLTVRLVQTGSQSRVTEGA